jgi:hypothetical protein
MGSTTSKTRPGKVAATAATAAAATVPQPPIPVLCELWPGFKEYTYDIRINFIGVAQEKIATVHKALRSVFTSKGYILSDVSLTLITSAIVPITVFESLQHAINNIPSLHVRWYDFVHLKTKRFNTP